MDLVPEFTFHATLGETLMVNGGPFGARTVICVTGGWAKGDRINGQIVGSGADWALLGADGYAQLDVRGQIRTDDGADLFIHYTGSLELNEAAATAAFSDAETSYADQYFRTHVRLESGAEQYAWVNRALFVGEGRLTSNGVEYEIYRLA
jgi:hypothetical protein